MMEDYSQHISSSEEIINAIKNGEMVILTDHENRENEGDLIIAAQFADAHAVNFMATHGRGLICLPMADNIISRLELTPMTTHNQTRYATPFMIPIEARDGVTTGISAFDRARTIAVAIDENSSKKDLVSPGHIFPLKARKGGVLERSGHTEAAVDLAKLAGLTPAAVICEIMNDDGTMARLPDLVAFSQKHDLKIGTIANLIAYRRRHDNLVTEIAQKNIHIDGYGDWDMRIFHDHHEHGEHIALIKGTLPKNEPCLVRMHRMNILNDYNIFHNAKESAINKALAKINDNGSGLLVLLSDKLPLSQFLKEKNADMNHADHAQKTFRSYGIGAQILCGLGIKNMILLSSSQQPRLMALEGYDLNISEIVKI